MFGFLNINKPAGVTSRDVVNKIHRVFPRETRIGHAGTLDPMATGVLVLCIGQATRLVPYVQDLAKSYRASFRLGCRSDTDDSTGTIVETPGARIVPREEIESALHQFRGRVRQTPPQYSALRVEGQRAYDLARAGKTVDLPPREVEVTRLELLRCEGNELEVDVDCSSGTYIRSIARDLGESLEVGGLMTSLVRTGVGPFRIESARSIDAISPDTISDALLPGSIAIGNRPRLVLTDERVAATCQGKKTDIPSEHSSCPTIAAVDAQGRLIALGQYEAEHSRFHPRIVLSEGLATCTG